MGQNDFVQAVEGVAALQNVDCTLGVRQKESLVLLVDVLLLDLLGVVLLFHLVVILEVAVLVQLPEDESLVCPGGGADALLDIDLEAVDHALVVPERAYTGQHVFLVEVHQIDDATGETDEQVACPGLEGTGGHPVAEV